MNLGSAKKWADAVSSGNYKFNDGAGLRYLDGSMCLVGVLEDVVTGNWEDGFCQFRTEDGSIGFPSKHTTQKCKLKTDLSEAAEYFVDNYRAPPAEHAEWIMKNYQRL